MIEASPETIYAGSDYLTQAEIALVVDVLGPAFAFTESGLSGGYDERRELAWDTLEAVRVMQDSLTDRRGQPLYISDHLSWRPSSKQLEELRTELAPVQRRFRMMRAADKCVKDETFLESLPGTPLRWNQLEIGDAAADFVLFAPRSTPEGGKSGAIVSPTGSGKTPAIAKTVAMLKHGELKQDPARILVLEPTQDLVIQTVGRKGDRGFGRFAPHLDVGEYYQHTKQLNKEVVVMCFPSFMKLFQEGKLPFFDAVIVDEAHLALAEKMGAAIKEYSKDKILILATATDRYSPEKTIFEIAQHEIYRMELVEAIHRGVLAPTRAFLLKAEPVIDESTLPLNKLDRKRAIREAYFRARLKAALPHIRAEVERGVGIFIKVPPGNTTGHAVDYAKIIKDMVAFGDQGMSRMKWIKANPVTSARQHQTREQQIEVLEEFDKGSGDALVSVRKLREGIHLPHNKGFFNCDPGESEVDELQWMGRSLSLTVDPFKKKPIEAHLYDFEYPPLGDKQATAVKLLKTKPGELVEAERPYAEEDKAARARRKLRRRPEAVRIDGINVGTIGEVAVGHGRHVQALIDVGALSVATATFQDDRLTLPRAAQELGIPPRELANLLALVNASAEDIRIGDLVRLRELFPEKLNFQELPAEGWADIRDVASNIIRNLDASSPLPRLLTFLDTARASGINSRPFKASYGVARFYSYRQVNMLRKQYGLRPLTTEELYNLSAHRNQA